MKRLRPCGQRRLRVGAPPPVSQVEVRDPAAGRGTRPGPRQVAGAPGLQREARTHIGVDHVEAPPRLAPGDAAVEILVHPGHDLDVAERNPQPRLDAPAPRARSRRRSAWSRAPSRLADPPAPRPQAAQRARSARSRRSLPHRVRDAQRRHRHPLLGHPAQHRGRGRRRIGGHRGVDQQLRILDLALEVPVGLRAGEGEPGVAIDPEVEPGFLAGVRIQSEVAGSGETGATVPPLPSSAARPGRGAPRRSRGAAGPRRRPRPRPAPPAPRRRSSSASSTSASIIRTRRASGSSASTAARWVRASSCQPCSAAISPISPSA